MSRSFNWGGVHFLSFNSETYVDGGIEEMVAFMTADLAAVDRAVTPWVVAYSHKFWVRARRVRSEGRARRANVAASLASETELLRGTRRGNCRVLRDTRVYGGAGSGGVQLLW